MLRAAERHVKLNNKGAYVGPYDISQTPYMAEPMEVLTSEEFQGCIFAKPAQCGGTEGLILNWLAYSAVVDPMDMIIYSPSMANARDFSIRRVDKLLNNSPDVRAKQIQKREADNKYDKQFTSGMLLNMSWPSVNEFAGKPVPRLALTDYDRFADDIGGDGNAFDLASKRSTTFLGYAMTVAESSPSKPILDPRWVASTPHEAPPCLGILGLYNRGDRRRYYWPCPHCNFWFEGRASLMVWDTGNPNIEEAAASVHMPCPSCGFKILPSSKKSMLRDARWVKDGQTIEDGRIFGAAYGGNIASFWLKGPAAGMVTWERLTLDRIRAEQEYERTKDEGSLRKWWNTDAGEGYVSKKQAEALLPENLKARAEELGKQGDPTVPENARCIIAMIDVQKNMFVVQVKAVLPGVPYDLVVVDRFNVIKSLRKDEDGDTAWVKPGQFLEDWDLLIDKVIERSYPVQGANGARMRVKITACDSGGEAGVTTMAYKFWRKIRQQGLGARFHLVKGEPNIKAPRTRISYPDSNRSDRDAGAMGDVPVLFLNSNLLKDRASDMLHNSTPGAGFVGFANWLPDSVYAEMCGEVNVEGKGWQKIGRRRNEAWDLLYYAIGVCASPLLGIETVNWLQPPAWLTRWETNIMVSKPEEPLVFTPEIKKFDFKSLGSALTG